MLGNSIAVWESGDPAVLGNSFAAWESGDPAVLCNSFAVWKSGDPAVLGISFAAWEEGFNYWLDFGASFCVNFYLSVFIYRTCVLNTFVRTNSCQFTYLSVFIARSAINCFIWVCCIELLSLFFFSFEFNLIKLD